MITGFSIGDDLKIFVTTSNGYPLIWFQKTVKRAHGILRTMKYAKLITSQYNALFRQTESIISALNSGGTEAFDLKNGAWAYVCDKKIKLESSLQDGTKRTVEIGTSNLIRWISKSLLIENAISTIWEKKNVDNAEVILYSILFECIYEEQHFEAYNNTSFFAEVRKNLLAKLPSETVVSVLFFNNS